MTDYLWTPPQATIKLREIARHRSLEITYKRHATERLGERNLVVSDVLYALKNGFVYIDAEAATRPGYYKYRMECRTPNSGSRSIGVIVIPEHSGYCLKVITVMWID